MTKTEEFEALLGSPASHDTRKGQYWKWGVGISSFVALVGLTSYKVGFNAGEQAEIDLMEPSGIKNLIADRDVAQIYKRTHFSVNATYDAAFIQVKMQQGDFLFCDDTKLHVFSFTFTFTCAEIFGDAEYSQRI